MKYKKRISLLGCLGFFCLLFFTFSTPSFVHSVSSLQMNFSGKIVTNDGLDISSNMPTCINSEGDDTCDFQIKYYDNDSAGVLLGRENFVDVELGDYRGYFNLKLGGGTYIAESYSSLKDIFLNEEDVYVEILFDGGGTSNFEFTNLELERFLISHSPVQRMSVGASPYSVSSRGSLDDFQLKVKTGSSGSNAGLIYFDGGDNLTKVHDGSTWQNLVYESMLHWNESGDDIYFSGGNVGIGTDTPGARLSVLGESHFAGNITNPLSSDNLPEKLRIVGVDLTTAKDFVVSGGYAYVIHDGVSGNPAVVRIYDVSNSGAGLVRTVQLIHTDLTEYSVVSAISVSEGRAYISADDSLLVLNVANPTVSNLYVEAAVQLEVLYSGSPVALKIQGRHGYVLDTAGELFVIDLSSTNPTVVSNSTLPAGVYGSFVVRGDRLYAVTDSSPSNLVVLNISDPSSVSQVGSTTVLSFNSAKEIFVTSRYAYISNGSTLYILDLFDSMVVKDSQAFGVSNVNSFALSGSYLFGVSASSPSSLYVLDVSNSSDISLLGSVAFGTSENNGRDIVVQGKYAYVATDAGIVVFDLKGIETNSLLANSFESFSGFIHNDLAVNKNLSVSGGVQVGRGGIYSDGSLTVEGQVRVVGGLGVGTGDNVYINEDGYLVASSSSLRYKRNVQPFGSVLSNLSNLELVSFTWNELSLSEGTEDIGMIAEDVAKYIPELVIYNDFGQPEGLKYEKMGLYAIAGLQELSEEFYSFKNRVESSEEKIYTSEEVLPVGTLVTPDSVEGVIKPFNSFSSPLLGVVREHIEGDEINEYKLYRYGGMGDYEALVSRSFESEVLEYPIGSSFTLGINGELLLIDEEDQSSLVVGYTSKPLSFEEDSFTILTEVYLSYSPLSFGFNSFALSSIFSQSSVYNGLTIGGDLVNFQGKTGSFLILNTDMLNVGDRVIIEVENEKPRIKVDGEDLLEEVEDLKKRIEELESGN